MKNYKMPFEPHPSVAPKKTSKSYLSDRLKYDRSGGGPYFLPKKQWGEIKRVKLIGNGGFSRFSLFGKHAGQSCVIACPGPSLADVNLGIIEYCGAVSFAVNVANFAFRPTYCSVAEYTQAQWMCSNKHFFNDRGYILTARAAMFFMAVKNKKSFGDVQITTWEEEGIVPVSTPAICVTNTLVTAWQMGFNKAYVLGLDLSREAGPYIEGVPYDPRGAKERSFNGHVFSFEGQLHALKQFELPDFEVINCSPVSKDLLSFEYLPYEKLQDAICASVRRS